MGRRLVERLRDAVFRGVGGHASCASLGVAFAASESRRAAATAPRATGARDGRGFESRVGGVESASRSFLAAVAASAPVAGSRRAAGVWCRRGAAPRGERAPRGSQRFCDRSEPRRYGPPVARRHLCSFVFDLCAGCARRHGVTRGPWIQEAGSLAQSSSLASVFTGR